MTSYIALLRKDKNSDYGVDFPDFPGCVTAGKTLEETRRMAEEALAFHIDGMIAGGETVPEPSDLDTIMSDPQNRDAVGFVVQVASRPGRAIRINVTLPEDLVRDIDRVTTNRSRFLAEAARRRLATEHV
jgi:predicted RNase H-like HicB family nuclease